MDTPSQKSIENFEDASRENESAECTIRQFERDQQQFRSMFSKLDKVQKGAWGERAVVNEAKNAGHRILLGHSENPTEQGFDCVSYELENNTLHIWEAKNFGETTSAVNSDKMTAWHDETKSGTKYADAREGYARNWKKILDSTSNTTMRDAIKQSISDGRVIYHVRIGPDTRISGNYKHELEAAQVPGSTYEWKQYTYADMLKSQHD